MCVVCECLQVVCQVSLVDEGYGSSPDDAELVIVGIEHLPDQMSVCVATDRGDVLLWNTANNEVTLWQLNLNTLHTVILRFII